MTHEDNYTRCDIAKCSIKLFVENYGLDTSVDLLRVAALLEGSPEFESMDELERQNMIQLLADLGQLCHDAHDIQELL